MKEIEGNYFEQFKIPMFHTRKFNLFDFFGPKGLFVELSKNVIENLKKIQLWNKFEILESKIAIYFKKIGGKIESLSKKLRREFSHFTHDDIPEEGKQLEDKCPFCDRPLVLFFEESYHKEILCKKDPDHFYLALF